MIRRLALQFIDTYQREVGPQLAVRCSLEPSCSAYGRTAFEQHGALRATRLTLARLRACKAAAQTTGSVLRLDP